MSISDALERKKLSKNGLTTLVAASTHLIYELPITNQIVSDARFLHPTVQMEKNAPFTTKILATFPEDFIEKEFSVSIC